MQNMPDSLNSPASAQLPRTVQPEPEHQLVLYDGVCGLCNRFIKMVLDNDPRGHFQFASLQSDLARQLLTQLGKDPQLLKSIYLVSGYGTDHVRLQTKARAALEICGKLDGPIALTKYLAILPTWLLNIGYDLVASNRYRLFGRHDSCPMPNPAHVVRFLDHST